MTWDVLDSGMTDFAQKILERQFLYEDATLSTGMVPYLLIHNLANFNPAENV